MDENRQLSKSLSMKRILSKNSLLDQRENSKINFKINLFL